MENLVDVIIPTYKPDYKFLKALEALLDQTIKPNKIIIINTDKNIWDKLCIEEKINKLNKENKFIIKHIEKINFDHGASRNLGAFLSNAKYFICMTMDAVAFDKYLVENLISKMSDSVKLTYARQVPNKDADIIENFTRNFNYPDIDILKTREDIKKYGIKTYFSSNVCACYEKESFVSLSGFRENVILNEDMFYAYDLLNLGKSLYYTKDAKVIHSHNYTGMQQLKRNFDIGVSQAMQKEIFEGISSENEGIKLVKLSIRHLLENKKAYLIPKLIYICVCKFIGFKLGKNYTHLPKFVIKHLSMNTTYFIKNNYFSR